MTPAEKSSTQSFIISRPGKYFPSEPDLTDPGSYWFSNWSKRMWPYRSIESGEIRPGTVLSWYVSGQKVIRWRTVIKKVKAFSYDSRAELLRTLEDHFGERPPNQEYLRRAKRSEGYCIAWSLVSRGKNKPEALRLQAPGKFKMEQLGWMDASRANVNKWKNLE